LVDSVDGFSVLISGSGSPLNLLGTYLARNKLQTPTRQPLSHAQAFQTQAAPVAVVTE
jgi:hypothetical protein